MLLRAWVVREGWLVEGTRGFPTHRVASNQSCLTRLLDLIAILQFNQAKLPSPKIASNSVTV
jgi:hypothetical protein